MPPPVAYRIEEGELWREEQRLFRGLDLLLHDRAVTALVGPGGGGKSSLLRVLGGGAGGAGGQWLLRGEPVPRAARWHMEAGGGPVLDDAGDPGEAILYVEQFRRTPLGAQSEPDWSILLALLRASRASVWLLDEPFAGAPLAVISEFEELLLETRGERCVVIISHDQRLLRAIADRVCLVCAGEVQQHDKEVFFENPPNRLVHKFVTSGNCWPSKFPPTIPLPSHFHWVLPDQLAGMGRPGLSSTADDDLAAIAAAGIRVLVSLTEEPVPNELLVAAGIEGRHFPIKDMGVPAAGPTARLCKFIENHINAGEAVAVHCHAGLGRTGTILAAFLVWQRVAPDEAIARVRAINKYFIQNTDQERFLHWFADQVG
jgi:atypical dual specificity phosphatase